MTGPGGNAADGWRALAHRAEWPLTEHFFRALFDFGILSEAGALSFTRLLLGGVGLFVSLGLLMARAYGRKAAILSSLPPEAYRRAALGDDLMLVGLPMLVVAFVTLAISHALLPDDRDFRVLGPLPIRRSAVFRAKLAALALFGSLVTAVTLGSLFPLTLLASFGDARFVSRLAVWLIASAGASLFVGLAITALMGTLTLALSRGRLDRVASVVRSVLFAVLVLCVPFVFRLSNVGDRLADGSAWLQLVPPAWFVALQQVLRGSTDPWFLRLAGIGVAALGAAAAVVALAYAMLFHRFERLVLRPAATPSAGSGDSRIRAVHGRTPAFRAVHQFTILTLHRSQLHQGVLLGLSAGGAAFALNQLLAAAPAGSLLDMPLRLPPAAAIWTPLGLMLVCGLGMRAALVLPMEHRANWIFRFTEDHATRADQLRAVERVVALYVVGVPIVVAAPVMFAALGPAAVLASAVVALVGLVFVHVVLLGWHRIPFTCSYLPGKRFLAASLLQAFFVYVSFTTLGIVLVRTALGGTVPAVIVAAVLATTAGALRRRRLAAWRTMPLMFEDELPDEPLQLRL